MQKNVGENAECPGARVGPLVKAIDGVGVLCVLTQ